jgi:two-component system, NtrC family, sensor histidine kinase KinB
MKLKTRILIALALMALLIVSVAIASTYFVQRLGSASESILQDNYASIGAVDKMIDALDRMDNAILYARLDPKEATKHKAAFSSADSIFANSLVFAEKNITEPGENKILGELRNRYERYRSQAPAPSQIGEHIAGRIGPLYDSLKGSCIELLNINTKGMNLRNLKAKEIANQAILYTTLLVGFALLLTLVMLIRFPALVIKPISELTSKIRQIANHKYAEHIEIKSQDEIGELASSFNQMATRLEEYDRSNIDALIAEKKQSEAIVKSMNDGVVVLTKDLTIVTANAAATKLLGIEEGDLIGKSAKDVGQYNSLLAKLIKNIDSTNGKPDDETYLQIFNKGKEEYYLKDIIRIERTEGDPASALGYVIELKNVSEFKALDEAKSGFVATVSHELRTPLSALNMSLRLLQDERIGQLNPEQTKILDAMKQEIRRLLRIVNELLELSRAEVGAEVMHIELVSPEGIVEAAVTPMMLQADQKNISLEINVQPNLPTVRADNSKIAWVLINLLSNAIRFTPSEGKVKLEVAMRNSHVEFSVTDTGIGIKPQDLERIFEKFFQVREKPVESHSGVGLGLAISKEIIEAHGGRISAESEVGKGTTFTFFLRSL